MTSRQRQELGQAAQDFLGQTLGLTGLPMAEHTQEEKAYGVVLLDRAYGQVVWGGKTLEDARGILRDWRKRTAHQDQLSGYVVLQVPDPDSCPLCGCKEWHQT